MKNKTRGLILNPCFKIVKYTLLSQIKNIVDIVSDSIKPLSKPPT